MIRRLPVAAVALSLLGVGASAGAGVSLPAPAAGPKRPAEGRRGAGSAAPAHGRARGMRPATSVRLDTNLRAPGFMGEPEAVILDRLRHERVVEVEKGRGGRSLAFKLTLASGAAGYFKPEQSFSGTNWYAEVVAHYLDRALGMGRVPPVVARQVPWELLAPAAGGDRRVDEIAVGEDGRVRGALVWWLPKPPVPAVTPAGWENWVRVEPFSRWDVTPLQRASSYGATIRARKEMAVEGRGPDEPYFERVPEPDRPGRAAALSDLLLFDFLTLNIDRWGGDNGNVLTLGEGGPLIFLDNAAGFSRGPHRRSLMDARFFICQRFRRRTIEALRTLDVAALGRAMARDPLGPLLDDHLLEGIAVRRRRVLEHVDRLRATHGDAAVLAW